MKYRIYVIEDDENIRNLIFATLYCLNERMVTGQPGITPMVPGCESRLPQTARSQTSPEQQPDSQIVSVPS